jgi:hypothetical protein
VVRLYSAMCFLLICFFSCSPFAALRKKTFTFTVNNQPQTLRIKVPKRYAKKQVVTDSAGNQQQFYRYKNGALLYMVYTTDTLVQFQPIDTAYNVPKSYAYGGQMYKGLDSSGWFWREIRTDSFRFGYRFVPPDVEVLFDSAVNYAAVRRFKK